MKFISIRDLRSNTARLRADLEAEKEIVVTANGRPIALMTAVEPDRLEESILEVRRARARSALSRARASARAKGTDRLDMQRIDAIVTKARQGRRRGR